jgi:hypothetical protein
MSRIPACAQCDRCVTDQIGSIGHAESLVFLRLSAFVTGVTNVFTTFSHTRENGRRYKGIRISLDVLKIGGFIGHTGHIGGFPRFFRDRWPDL